MTGTEVLMEVAEGFGRDGEALDLIVVYADENGHVHVKGNCLLTRALGLARYAEKHVRKILLQGSVQ